VRPCLSSLPCHPSRVSPQSPLVSHPCSVTSVQSPTPSHLQSPVTHSQSPTLSHPTPSHPPSVTHPQSPIVTHTLTHPRPPTQSPTQLPVTHSQSPTPLSALTYQTLRAWHTSMMRFRLGVWMIEANTGSIGAALSHVEGERLECGAWEDISSMCGGKKQRRDPRVVDTRDY
jgi:hypothetical protein